tara:strand:- start:286 stop:585 length:300 start_codon:yes stop_codon:yes gene_type:complete
MLIRIKRGKYWFEIEILTSQIKVFKEDETKHFAQLIAQTGDVEHVIVKGLESPIMSASERKDLNKRIVEVLQSFFGYKTGSFQRKKNGEFISVNLRMKK